MVTPFCTQLLQFFFFKQVQFCLLPPTAQSTSSVKIQKICRAMSNTQDTRSGICLLRAVGTHTQNHKCCQNALVASFFTETQLQQYLPL